MILRDPVHGLVEFEGGLERVALALLETRELQRLRRVRQLGLTSVVFPGAEHSRFAHALGAAHVMTRLQHRIRAVEHELPPELRLDEGSAMDAFAAAMLHDLGHGPFSHLFEEVVERAIPHEEWTAAMLSDPSTDVHRALESISAGMSARVRSLVDGDHPLAWLASTVSGVVDVDRCDYLLRDSHMTGVAYGTFDLDWLFRALTFAEHGAGDVRQWRLAIEGRKGLPPIESFFLARHFMYHQVYHHKATRAAECLVRAVFRRVAELVREGRPPRTLPAPLALAIRGERPSVGAYLELDDHQLMYAFAEWESERDATLADLTGRFRARRLPKTIPLDEDPAAEPRWHEALRRASEVAARRGLDPALYVWLDVAEDVPYSEDDADDGLFVALRHHPLQRLGDISFALQKLRGQRIVRPRLCFAGELRDDIVRALDAT